MKTRIIGVIVLALVIIVGGAYYLFDQATQCVTLSGYIGGEKIGLFEDEEAAKILRQKYQIEFDYSRAGSLDMVTADLSGRDYLFPSSQIALEYYNELYGSAAASEIVFNTPIVLYTHRMVADALISEGVVSQKDGVYYADMQKLTQLMLDGKQWSDIGLPQLYGSVAVDTTDPARSNSGNMFAALLANVLNGGKTVDEASVDNVLPQMKEIFSKLGYMETSSSDLFNQFMSTGVGAKPIIAGYENQILEYAAESPESYEKIKDDIIIIYPTPTVWSSHIYIALDDAGKEGITALADEEIQRIAWEKHGFRTGSFDITGGITVDGIAETLTSVMNMPDYKAMKKIIDDLS